jgi:hypothetical protein
MRLDLSAELFAFPDRNGLDLNAREDRLQILEASMNVLGDNHVVGGLVYRHWMMRTGRLQWGTAVHWREHHKISLARRSDDALPRVQCCVAPHL